MSDMGIYMPGPEADIGAAPSWGGMKRYYKGLIFPGYPPMWVRSERVWGEGWWGGGGGVV